MQTAVVEITPATVVTAATPATPATPRPGRHRYTFLLETRMCIACGVRGRVGGVKHACGDACARGTGRGVPSCQCQWHLYAAFHADVVLAVATFTIACFVHAIARRSSRFVAMAVPRKRLGDELAAASTRTSHTTIDDKGTEMGAVTPFTPPAASSATAAAGAGAKFHLDYLSHKAALRKLDEEMPALSSAALRNDDGTDVHEVADAASITEKLSGSSKGSCYHCTALHCSPC